MNRLHKKCFIVSAGFHLFLALILVVGPAFLSSKSRLEDMPVIDFVPSKLVDAAVMAPGVAAALITTVAGLLVAIPSMFGYNWLVHNLRVLTVQLDNFAQELVSKMETEYLEEA